ncbi:MAG: hypothetical protein ACRDTA_22235 [Pseudonocardiaceae bacterium]
MTRIDAAPAPPTHYSSAQCLGLTEQLCFLAHYAGLDLEAVHTR